MTKSMEILAEGSGELLGWHDPDENRAWVRDHILSSKHQKAVILLDGSEGGKDWSDV
jgi:hypothetical protein